MAARIAEATREECQSQGAAVALAWRTASETNSAYFGVERSLDGVAFSRLGSVAAQGTALLPTTYAYRDASLPMGATQLYYRLRQVDCDGSSTYLPVRPVALAGAGGLTLLPNPAHGSATLLGAAPGVPVVLLGALGRTIATATADAAGTAQLLLPAGLPGGVYVVRAGAQVVRLLTYWRRARSRPATRKTARPPVAPLARRPESRR